MNILYILGNGFDKAQGMATSYPEFYEYLKKEINYGSPLFKLMQREITQNVNLWSDMELALGNFTSSTDSEHEFDSFYFELLGHLQTYLKAEDAKFSPTDKLKLKCEDDLTGPSKFIEALDKTRYNDFIKPYINSFHDIHVLTLNYTYSFEKILHLTPSSSNIKLRNNCKLQKIIHLHGELDNSIIVGVDNEEQMKNISFRNNENIKDCMVKIQSNESMKTTRHLDYKKMINNANLIVLFGVSLGDTDAYLWRTIGENLEERKNVALIHHIYAPNAVPPTQMQKRGRLEREQQELIRTKMGIKQENWTNEIKNKLFFTLNKSIFKL